MLLGTATTRQGRGQPPLTPSWKPTESQRRASLVNSAPPLRLSATPRLPSPRTVLVCLPAGRLPHLLSRKLPATRTQGRIRIAADVTTLVAAYVEHPAGLL